MDRKVLQTQQLTGGWWMRGLGSGEETADLKLSLFPFLSTNPRLHFTASVLHGEGREQGGTWEGRDRKGWDGGGEVVTIVQLVLLCWFHPWLRTPVVLALHHQHPSTLGVIRPLCVQFPVSAGTRGSPMMFML